MFFLSGDSIAKADSWIVKTKVPVIIKIKKQQIYGSVTSSFLSID